jgi:sugar-specific transcriptional regulator TrmB
LKLNKQYVYARLRILCSKGAVTTTDERPARFKALSFAAVLEVLMKAKTVEAQLMEQHKKEILANWQSVKEDLSFFGTPK